VRHTEERPKTIRELLRVASGWLTERGIEGADLDTQLLLAHTLGCRRLDLFLDHDRPLQAEELTRFRALMRRRGDDREPVAYLLGERDFFGLGFFVTRDVLVPRPETEHLVEVALDALDARGADAPAARFADVGTGSGCVGVAVAKLRPLARGLLIDISPAALAVARRNVERHGVGERVDLLRSDLLCAVGDQTLDLVVANPPYVGEDEVHLLPPEVLRHEPHGALFDRPGLPLTQALAAQAARALRPGGTLAVETGWGSAARVEELLLAAGFTEVRRVPDLSRVERLVLGRRQGPDGPETAC